MPTKRPRHVVTETDEVARALDAAAERWPAERANRAKLVLRLLQEGGRAVADDYRRRLADRREAVASTGGALTGLYGPQYLGELREDWPP